MVLAHICWIDLYFSKSINHYKIQNKKNRTKTLPNAEYEAFRTLYSKNYMEEGD